MMHGNRRTIVYLISVLSCHSGVALRPPEFNNAPYRSEFGRAAPDDIVTPPSAYQVPNQDSWEQYENQQPQQSHYGEAKSFKPLELFSAPSVAITFFLMIWRSVHHFEIADSFKGAKRVFLVVPIVALFLGNLLACVTAFTSGLSSHVSKRRSKAILNLDKLVELILFANNILKLLFPSPYVAREIYIGGAIHNVMFILLCHSITKLSFGGLAASVGATENKSPYYGQQQYGYPTDNYEDYYGGQNQGGGDEWGN
mmetsp:Transcript_14713/g.22807  ORF Transcript_14713/g.22807 Transcript_14713/m.22807 type:complete len:255 (-) Transcript_14713:263-1027(-)|eukprot:CAMPEP_0196814944 /NCGR_PEP_ID=MMETSP1362-20130617/46974_1 /TAXON_ID=163516 /ORGANISM="Leptocylindrus danicus, Strain CCMP1856" /LENGTH=254 /DNA_ID=CAMNT_0042191749 /DNA_START=47 /DNA_END=811 /DNA_ORIENTATION=+